MKTKHILILTLILSFFLVLNSFAANINTGTQSTVISYTTNYSNSMSETWNITSSDLTKPLIIAYNIGTEANYDYVTINEVDNNGNFTSQILRISGTQSGAISTTTPNGRVQVVFTSDGSVCYANNNSLYWGINVNFAINYNNIVNNNLQITGDGYFTGKVGIGTLAPQVPLHLTKTSTIGNSTIAAILGNSYNDWTNYGSATGGRIRGASTGFLVIDGNPNGTGDKNLYLNFGCSSNIVLGYGGGNVGVGANLSPTQALDIERNADFQLRLGNNGGLGYNIGRNGTTGYLNFYGDQSGYNGYVFGGANGTFMTINNSGKVGIGIDNIQTNALLTVNGTIHAKEVNVSLDGLADYVFDSNYKLMPLSEVEQFVYTNKHLPSIPSATEVQAKGMNMGEMQNKLLQKIEELTLYMIDMKKTIDTQNVKIEQQSNRIKELENKLFYY